MSTKTTFKRIALVAAVAAAFGGLSTVAANATAPAPAAPAIAATGGTTATGGTSSAATASAVTGGYVAETVTAGTADKYYTITSTGVGTLAIGSTGAATGGGSTNYTVNSPTNVTWYGGTAPGLASFASAGTDVLNFSATSSVAGTQTITVTGNSSTAITEVITWSAAQIFSAGLSTAILNNVTHIVSAPSDDTVSVDAGSAPSSLNAAGVIAVALKGNDGNAYVKGSVSATVSGPALIVVDGTNTVAPYATTWGYGNSMTASTGAAYIHIESAGVAGVATITVTATDANAVATVIATKTVTFTGATAAIKAVGNLSVLKAGGTTYALTATAAGATTVATTIPLSAYTTDANGNKVSSSINTTAGYIVKAVSSDSTVLTGGTCSPAVASSAGATGFTTTATAATTGEYNCPVTGTALAASGKSATITVTVFKSDATTVVASSSPITFTIGGVVAKVAISTDATSYVLGAPVSFIATATDSAGNAAYDQDYNLFSTAPTSSTILETSSLPGTGSYTLVGGKHTFTGSFAPVFSTTVVISAVDNLTALNALSTSFAVTNPSDATVSAATDAANEATDAANAATDAANAAADAADAATAAAQDASAQAQAALAAVNALSAKITVLAAQIAKIIKKLGA
jgi:hypothetical protein